jgi:hypothetical protein
MFHAFKGLSRTRYTERNSLVHNGVLFWSKTIGSKKGVIHEILAKDVNSSGVRRMYLGIIILGKR